MKSEEISKFEKQTSKLEKMLSALDALDREFGREDCGDDVRELINSYLYY